MSGGGQESGAQAVAAEARVDGERERGGAGYLRGGHTRAGVEVVAEAVVAAVRVERLGEDAVRVAVSVLIDSGVAAGGDQGEAPAVVGIGGELAVEADRPDGDTLGVAGRV